MAQANFLEDVSVENDKLSLEEMPLVEMFQTFSTILQNRYAIGNEVTLPTFTSFIKFSMSSSFIYIAELSLAGGAEGALASPEFGSSVNPIPTKGGMLCPPRYC